MATHDPTDAEVFYRFIGAQFATGGLGKSPEELLRLFRERQAESANSVAAIEEGLSDIDAGRIHSFAAVNDEIRRKHGWSNPE